MKQEPLRDVAGGCRYRVNNYLDHKYRPQPVNKIIGAAKEMVGEEIEYSVLSRNCEHFVTNLRYGAASSRQVRPSLGWSLSLLEVCLGWGSAAVQPEWRITVKDAKWALRDPLAGSKDV